MGCSPHVSVSLGNAGPCRWFTSFPTIDNHCIPGIYHKIYHSVDALSQLCSYLANIAQFFMFVHFYLLPTLRTDSSYVTPLDRCHCNDMINFLKGQPNICLSKYKQTQGCTVCQDSFLSNIKQLFQNAIKLE